MFGKRDRLTQLAILEQVAKLTEHTRKLQQLLREMERDLSTEKRTGELVNEGIANLMNFTGQPKKGE